MYWKNLELTGASEGTKKKRKFSKLKCQKDTLIPAMDETAQRLSEGGRYKVIFVYQEDNAGLNQHKDYQQYLCRALRTRGWLVFRQPPQSPLFNICDRRYFPKSSKQVSQEQAVSFGSRLAHDEELHRIVTRVYNDERNLPAVALE